MMKLKALSRLLTGFLILNTVYGCGQPSAVETITQTTPMTENTSASLDTATFGSGCFWCTEAIFQMLNGVVSAESGYTGGHVENPTYRQVCTGETGHAEVVRVIFDPKVISYAQLLEAFWASHDPTTLNRQGNDVGTQYRSVIYYHNEGQQQLAVEMKARLNAEKVFPNPIVTEISPAVKFYPAENYHQEYYELNGSEPYCTFVIKPKLDKFRKVFKDQLRTQ